MKTGKLCLAAVLAALPALATAQPSVSVDVGVNVGVDNYDTVAPGVPVASVDVFYDQLSPYGVWVDDPDVGRVFIADNPNYVPYTIGHWQFTNLGFVWISTEPFAWATSHYGRWAFSRYYGRWIWLPDTEWGPAWVEWRQTGTDFGWAPLPPDIVVRTGWQPPIEAWHYCSADRILDVNVTRYYQPRERVVEIHRQARPIEHYSTISNVKVVVGPPASTLREHRIAVRPVKVEPRTVGRWNPTEARAQVERARQRSVTVETQNQRRIESNPKLHTAQVKVIEAHPQIKAQIDARVQGRATPPEPNRVAPAGAAPGGRPEPTRTAPGGRPAKEPPRTEPERAAPNAPATPPRREPTRPAEPERAVPRAPAVPAPRERTEPGRPAEPERAVPKAPAAPAPRAPGPPVERPAPRTPEQHGRDQRPGEPNTREQSPQPRERAPVSPELPVTRGRTQQPPPPAPPASSAAEPTRRAPEPRTPERAPERAQPSRTAPPRSEPPPAERKEPERRAPDQRKDPERKDKDRAEPDRH